MNYILEDVNMWNGADFVPTTVAIGDNLITDFSPSAIQVSSADEIFYLNKLHLFAGFIDVHVHLREPGFSHKETIKSGTQASARGGYTAVCTMPNLNPTPDSLENLQIQLDLIKETACIHVYPLGTITKGERGEELADLDALLPHVVGFSDDGRGVQNDDMMKQAMIKAKEIGGIIVAHCEDNSLLNKGYIHDGEYAKLNNHRGICSASEWKQVERDLKLVEEIGCKYHVCHISSKETVEVIRQAKSRGVNVTCETAPHYLVLNDMDLQEHGRFKMNPPIRGEEDRLALIDGILDGTIDMIATDHAPHSAEEKARGLEMSAFGIVGIETAFATLYTHLVKKDVITLNRLMELMHINPMKRFGIGSTLEKGQPADFTVFDLESSYKINPDEFLSQGKSTPLEGMEVFGKCVMTACGGEIVYKDDSYFKK